MREKTPWRADLLDSMHPDLGRYVPTGMAYYDDTFLPAECRHRLYVAEWGRAKLLRYPLRTDLVLPGIEGPVLLLHGDRDTTIPVEHSRRLLAAVPTARLAVIEGAGHNDLQAFDAYRQALAEALTQR